MNDQRFESFADEIEVLVRQLGRSGSLEAWTVGFSKACLRLRDEHTRELKWYSENQAQRADDPWAERCLHALAVLEPIDPKSEISGRVDGLHCCSSMGALVALYDAEPDEDRRQDYLDGAERWQVCFPECDFRHAFNTWRDQRLAAPEDQAIVQQLIETVTDAVLAKQSQCLLEFDGADVAVNLPVPAWGLYALSLTADQIAPHAKTRRGEKQRKMLLRYVYNGEFTR